MNLKNINCPLCNSSDYIEIYHQKAVWLDIEYTNVVCKNCGFIFRNPAMDWNECLQLYQDSNNLLSSSQYVNYEEGSRSNKLRKERLKFLFNNIPFNRGTILDVGGGDGFLLDGFDSSIWNKVMVEPGNLAVVAMEKNIEVFKMGVEVFDYSKNFDVILCMGVLEHLSHPRGSIKKMSELLSSDGYLSLEVPNSLTPNIKISDFYSFEHIGGFTFNSLDFLLNTEGLKIVSIDRNTQFPILRILAKKDDCLKNKESKSDYLNIIDIMQKYKYKRKSFENEIKEKLDVVFDIKYRNKIAIYGAGDHTIQLLNTINFLDAVSCFLDSDISKQGKQFLGKPVFSPDQLDYIDIDIVLLSSGDYQHEMYKQVKKFEEEGRIKIVKLYPEGTI